MSWKIFVYSLHDNTSHSCRLLHDCAEQFAGTQEFIRAIKKLRTSLIKLPTTTGVWHNPRYVSERAWAFCWGLGKSIEFQSTHSENAPLSHKLMLSIFAHVIRQTNCRSCPLQCALYAHAFHELLLLYRVEIVRKTKAAAHTRKFRRRRRRHY